MPHDGYRTFDTTSCRVAFPDFVIASFVALPEQPDWFPRPGQPPKAVRSIPVVRVRRVINQGRPQNREQRLNLAREHDFACEMHHSVQRCEAFTDGSDSGAAESAYTVWELILTTNASGSAAAALNIAAIMMILPRSISALRQGAKAETATITSPGRDRAASEA